MDAETGSLDNTPPFPPLLGDSQGRYRVHIVGNSGAGKSTTGIALAGILGVPYISMDKIMWQPGWVETPRDEFQARLRAALDQNPERGWVADGDYQRKGGRIAFDEATDIIWLDPPLLLYFPRIIWRTLLRLLRLTEPCSPGCPELFSEVFFSRKSIVWWCIRYHWQNRRWYQEKMDEVGLESGRDVGRRRMRRIGGWGGELRGWLRGVEDMIEAQKKAD